MLHIARECPSLRYVLVVLVVAALLAIVHLALSMCRLAARSDRAQAVALAQWLAAREAAQATSSPAEQLSFEQRRPRRATG